jgi:hypothetical protein
MHRSYRGPEVSRNYVVGRLEEAGRTILILPEAARWSRLTTHMQSFMAETIQREGYAAGALKLTAEPAAIDRMDEAFGWLSLIAMDRYVLRRIVGARSLVNPLTGKHLYSWRRVAGLLRCDHKAVQRWHAQGIDLIVQVLRERHPARRDQVNDAA